VTDLVFGRGPLTGSPVDLVFNDEGNNEVFAKADFSLPDLGVEIYSVGEVSFSLDASLPGPALEVWMGPLSEGTMDATLPGLESVEVTASYESNTARPVVGRAVSPWNVAVAEQIGVEHGQQGINVFVVGADAKHRAALALAPAGALVRASAAQPTPRRNVARHSEGVRAGPGPRKFRHQQGVGNRRSLASNFQEAQLLRKSNLARHADMLRRPRPSLRATWDEGAALPVFRSEIVQSASYLRSGRASEFQAARRPPIGQWDRTPLPPLPGEPPCYTPSGDLIFTGLLPSDLTLVFRCERQTAPDNGLPALVVVPVRKVYIVLNNVTLRRVADSVQLPALSLSMSLDADSWTWGFSASLPITSRDAVMPSGGVPVELEATLNGIAFRLLAERVSTERTYGRATLSVRGRGTNAVLDAPYAAVRTFGNAAGDRTAQQLMGDALTLNGVPIGWAVDWGLTDWLVPAGAWAFQGTTIGALTRIAQAAGGYLQPHPTLDTIRVLPRYPTAPWAWGTVTPDLELPSSVTSQEGIEWTDRAVYNRVFVSGEGVGGILGQITRQGTAGDALAPMVTDALITHADAARQRGISILAATGRTADVTLRLPVLPETGVITPGKFVRYTDGAVQRFGIVRSVGIEGSGRPELWQTIGVETHVA
jgi:hypothetical protein